MRYGANRVFTNEQVYDGYEKSSLVGVGVKTIILLLCAILTSLLCMMLVTKVDLDTAAPIVFVGYFICPILTFIFSMVMSFKPLVAKSLAIPYAILEGVSIGAISGLLKLALGEVGGTIVGLAFVIVLTFFLAAALVYSTGLVNIGSGFRRFALILGFGLIMSTFFITLGGLINPWIRELFYGETTIALIFCIISVLIASIYSLITLDNAKRMVDNGLDERYEWFAAFGIVLNLIWLFWEVLRLVAIIASRSSKR